MTGLDSIQSPLNKILSENMAIARTQGTVVSTSISSQELSGNGGEYENGPVGYTVQKKRRLNVDKAKLLEKYFDMDSKLEPQRKMELSQRLDIHPKQVAVWFQNRRARSKTKTLQTDYDALKLSYLELKSDYQGLLQEKQNLMSELQILKKRVANISQDVFDEEIESAEKEITKSISSFENPTSARDSMNTGEDVLNVQPFSDGRVRSEDNSNHLPYRGYSRVDEQPPSSLKVLPDHLTARTTEEGALCGRFANPFLPPHQQFLRSDDSLPHSEEHNCFPNVEDQAAIALSWWGGWP